MIIAVPVIKRPSPTSASATSLLGSTRQSARTIGAETGRARELQSCAIASHSVDRHPRMSSLTHPRCATPLASCGDKNDRNSDIGFGGSASAGSAFYALSGVRCSRASEHARALCRVMAMPSRSIVRKPLMEPLMEHRGGGGCR